MTSFSTLYFLLFYSLQAINVSAVAMQRDNKFVNIFLVAGICVAAIQFLVYLNVIDFSYSEDLLVYRNWYERMNYLSSFTEIRINDKDPGFSLVLYMLSQVTSDFSQVVFLLGLYILSFNAYLARFFTRNENLQAFLYVFFFLLTIILLNRLVLGQYTNTIRSFFAGSLLIIVMLKCFDRKYYWLLLVPFVYFIHKFQLLMFVCLVLGYRFVPTKWLFYTTIIAIINLPFGMFEKVFTAYIAENIDFLKTIYSSTILSNDMRFTWSRKFQIIMLLIIPLAIIMRQTFSGPYLKKEISDTDSKIIKFVMFTTSIYLLLVDVLPIAERFIIFVFPFLYIMLVKYANRTVTYSYALLSIFLSFVAFYRNSEHLIIS